MFRPPMSAEPSSDEFFQGNEATQARAQGMSVVVGRIDGSVLSGRAGWFEPAEPDLVVDAITPPGGPA